MKKLLSVLLCAIMVFGAIPFAASAAVSATDLTITTKPLATGKYGQVTSAQSIIEIPENASGDVEIPLDFLNEFEENVTMPGDTYTYYFTIINHSKHTYEYTGQSFVVSVLGDMNDPKWNKFYSELFSVSFTRTLNMASSSDTDCGIANYMDTGSDKYKEVNSLLSNTKIASGDQTVSQAVYIGLNGPLMGNAYANCSFSGNMKFMLHEADAQSEPGQNTGDMVTVPVTTPKKMSIRLEDGTVLHSGDSFQMPKDGTVQFQMCTDNWETNRYTDDGEGFAGTKVYSFTYSNKNKVLRTDTNTYFMAYRFHFKKGDYNKQTGIANVIETPLESWSVNLPLGSTVTADAYKGAVTKVDAANVFIETAEDKTICYTDYYWEY